MPRIAVIPGEGAAPEAVAATLDVFDRMQLGLAWDFPLVGDAARDQGLSTFPEAAKAQIDAADATFFGATSGPSGRALFYLRWGKQTFANVRPIRWRPGFASPLKSPEGLDLVIVRENLEDSYVGLEGDLAELAPLNLISPRTQVKAHALGPGAYALKAITERGSERIVRFAFQLAARRRAEGRPGHVTASAKDNMLPKTDGLFIEVARRVSAEFPEIGFETLIVDDLAHRLVVDPHRFDVIVLPNLYGDILSDAAAGLAGGLGLAPSGCYGDAYAYFESAHGTAPDIAGQGIVNPTATLLSGAMMLAHLGFDDAAERVRTAVDAVYARGRELTPDQGGGEFNEGLLPCGLRGALSMPRSLFEKLWDSHVIESFGGGMDLLWVDRHLLHDLSGPASLKMLAQRGLPVRRPALTFAVPDHGVSTAPGRAGGLEPNDRALRALRRDCEQHGIKLFDIHSDAQGIVHVVAPELGLTLPGLSIVCGDSHTCTQGAFGALAWGIGNTEITQVLATQALIVERPASMRINVDGRLARGVTAKDLILFLIGTYGAAGGAGRAVEFAGEAISALSMDARMSLCNLAVEFGARFGFVAPDEVTFAYLEGRPYAPQSPDWDEAVRNWRELGSDPDATFDAEISVDASAVERHITWGTSPEHVVPLGGRIPDPADAPDEKTAEAWRAALHYMSLTPGAPIVGTSIQHVFIGSCANGRLSDLVAAAVVVRGRRVADGVRAWIVPGSQPVKRAAEALGLDEIFRDAGFEWREPGCSMCLAMNGDQVPPGERAVSTSNRNFVGRQGPGARTHLASPASAAAAAIAGRIVDGRTAL